MSSSQPLMNQGVFEDHEVHTQMGFFPFPSNSTYDPQACHQSVKAYTIANHHHDDRPSTNNLTAALLSSPTQKQRSNANLWTWGGEVNEGLNMSKRNGGDDHHLGVSSMKMKKMKLRRKVREPRFCFKTMSDVDVLDDGYKWRKYGQKVVKNTQHPRSYYRCTQDNCRVKKRVERLAEDPRMVITTYEGRHVHSPSPDVEDSQTPSTLNNFFW